MTRSKKAAKKVPVIDPYLPHNGNFGYRVSRYELDLEYKVAVERGKVAESAGNDEKIAVMQRKANIGMNAILSASLALGRLVAAREGKELSDILGEMEGNIDRDSLYSVK